MSLLLKVRREGREIGTATGFLAMSSKGPMLMTNYHVISSLRADDQQPVAPGVPPPDEIEILHNLKGRPGAWFAVREPLYDAGGKRWVEHPKYGNRADIVALPLTNLENVELIDYPLTDYPPIAYGPAEPISIVGFPFGKSAGFVFPIWATGFVASQPQLDYEYLPVFLVDCRSRQGQSGSPVIAYRTGSFLLENGAMLSGGADRAVFRLLGMYSGRIHKESDIGMVWKLSAIAELINSII
jgi:hypothetical protein